MSRRCDLTFDPKDFSAMSAIDTYFEADHYAVGGASPRAHKYGYKVLRALLDSGRHVDPIHPAADEILGRTVYPRLQDCPIAPQSLSIITPPEITRKLVDDAIEVGVRCVWMQPGAEDAEASRKAREAGLEVIDDGSCILVALSLGR